MRDGVRLLSRLSVKNYHMAIDLLEDGKRFGIQEPMAFSRTRVDGCIGGLKASLLLWCRTPQ